MTKSRFLRIFFIFTFITHFCFSDEAIIINNENLRELTRLSSYEQTFKEYCNIVEKNYKEVAAGRKPSFIFYKYTNNPQVEKFDLLGLASRCNIPYETIATLNHLESATQSIAGKTLILPTVRGLYICADNSKNDLELLLQQKWGNQTLTKQDISYKINDTSVSNFYFLQDKRLSPTERAFFLDSALQLPLAPDSYWVSSEFGKRKNPFSGKIKNHNGIDLAANEGTPVHAIKDGAVAYCIENDAEFGNYIVISHDQGKMTSVYAHLSEICVEQYETIKKGDLIGFVGQTGMATGPHLHFEIRVNGKPDDPRSKLKL